MYQNQKGVGGVLAVTLSELEALHESRHGEAAKALELLLTIRNRALFCLQKVNFFFNLLTPLQKDAINRQFESGSFILEEIMERSLIPFEQQNLKGKITVQLPVLEWRSVSLRRVAIAKKNILQFGLICARAGELSGTITRAIKVFDRQYKAACRYLFPLGVFSKIWRNIRRFFSFPYFSYRDMGTLRCLGATAGFVLKMAEAPV
jgi:hypothetical protein